MRLIRSMCAAIPPDRNYIVDDADKIYNSGWDYKELLRFRDDIIHVDWDTAVSREALTIFADEARKNPESVLVAPQKLYPVTTYGEVRPEWNCYLRDENGTDTPVNDGAPRCDIYGFGLVYLPRHMIEEYIAANPLIEFRDTSFGPWHLENYGQTRICWEAMTVHLHYRISEVIR